MACSEKTIILLELEGGIKCLFEEVLDYFEKIGSSLSRSGVAHLIFLEGLKTLLDDMEKGVLEELNSDDEEDCFHC